MLLPPDITVYELKLHWLVLAVRHPAWCSWWHRVCRSEVKWMVNIIIITRAEELHLDKQEDSKLCRDAWRDVWRSTSTDYIRYFLCFVTATGWKIIPSLHLVFDALLLRVVAVHVTSPLSGAWRFQQWFKAEQWLNEWSGTLRRLSQPDNTVLHYDEFREQRTERWLSLFLSAEPVYQQP